LHKALIDAERRRYERVNGRIGSPHAALRLVLADPWFRWLHPLADVIVKIDERLSDEKPMDAADAEAFATRARALLQQDGGGPTFQAEYRRSLQEAAEVVVAHGRVVRFFANGPQLGEPDAAPEAGKVQLDNRNRESGAGD
jgi:hypothetical protein